MLEQMLFDCCSLHAGQACILHSRLLLPDSLHDDVVERLVELAREVKVGDPTDPEVQMGPLISAAQRDRVEAHVAGARERRSEAGDRRRSSGRLGCRLLLRADDSDRRRPGLDYRPGGSLRTGADGASLPRRRRRGRDRQQLAVRAVRRGVGRRRGPRRRRCAPHPHRPDRRQRLRVPATRRSAASSRAGWAARAVASAACISTWSRRPSGFPRDGTPRRAARRRNRRTRSQALTATKLLVDLGAEVTKIEPPGGDPLRRWGPFPAACPTPTLRPVRVPQCRKARRHLDLEPDAWRPPAS